MAASVIALSRIALGIPADQSIADINAVFLDTPANLAGPLPGDISEAADSSGLAEIQHELVRMIGGGRPPLCMPEIGGLTIDRVLGAAVFPLPFFAIGIGHSPALVAERGARFVKQIQFGD